MRFVGALIFLLAFAAGAAAAPSTPEQRVADLNWLVDQLQKNYAYSHSRHVDIASIARLYRDDALKAGDDLQWIAVLERIIAELYDHHASLNTNTPSSPQLVPSGADIWGQVVGGVSTITQVRAKSVAHRAGVRPGMTVVSIAGEPASKALARWMPRSLTKPDAEAESYALRVLLAGNHVAQRQFVACAATSCLPFALAPAESWKAEARVAFEIIDGDLGYLRIENSLGDGDTAADVDRALAALKDAQGLTASTT